MQNKIKKTRKRLFTQTQAACVCFSFGVIFTLLLREKKSSPKRMPKIMRNFYFRLLCSLNVRKHEMEKVC